MKRYSEWKSGSFSSFSVGQAGSWVPTAFTHLRLSGGPQTYPGFWWKHRIDQSSKWRRHLLNVRLGKPDVSLMFSKIFEHKDIAPNTSVLEVRKKKSKKYRIQYIFLLFLAPWGLQANRKAKPWWCNFSPLKSLTHNPGNLWKLVITAKGKGKWKPWKPLQYIKWCVCVCVTKILGPQKKSSSFPVLKRWQLFL